MITVVGIGADGMAGLAPASSAELRRAPVIYGAKRQLDLLDESVTAERREWGKPFLQALCAIRDFDGDVHVVASGDPMLHGVGASLIRVCGADRVRVLPHVSSVALACARLGWSVQDTEVISLMTAGVHSAVRRGGQAIVLCRDGFEPGVLATVLADAGLGDSQMTVLEQLGGPAERRRVGVAQDWAATPPDGVDDLNVVAIRYLPDERLLSVLPDDALAHDGQLTKQSMRAVTLAALAPRPGELLWDVGAGSGSIAVEWCRAGSDCTAVAFERDEQRRSRIAMNALRFGANIEVRGAAPEAFADAELTDGGVTGVQTPAAIFIGGGLTAPGLLDACLQRLPSGGRLVANTVTVESEAVLLQYYSKLGGRLRRFQHYRGEAVGGFTGWRPAMPVTQWAVRKP
ncbi:bifunctional cobalt-precorrin-7 (C(5))-methyltransferase/cobalt-precorrin-6B (C(15))-methyltransferase [Mycobacterium sp. EPa45]|uniref:bifunctional cobalt-precorrin-7 (C(5))-methyltransferase/cobalt-precorrin-6B (C(15))-methyltransferase n=1 Tax=Mycobacterium sp. EPa45 TaxID=1545728 RepID=UPI00064248B3|nr:bifunctional cobalt-precorrin-7 (C(5))-methyltransferase/cobalt-precorrin-6B (C(15))-methyltransferase [Mycobacterium sp. EPa45]AKK30541.1 precorrin-6Y-methylase [Mycobacterium sp. EPa45]